MFILYRSRTEKNPRNTLNGKKTSKISHKKSPLFGGVRYSEGVCTKNNRKFHRPRKSVCYVEGSIRSFTVLVLSYEMKNASPFVQYQLKLFHSYTQCRPIINVINVYRNLLVLLCRTSDGRVCSESK